MAFAGNKSHNFSFCTLVSGNTANCHLDFEKWVQKEGLRKVDRTEECDFILIFCPIVSRAGPDIEQAMQMLNKIPDSKPAVLVVLHHTFDPYCTVPDSSRSVTRENTTTVDCLFHEDQGLLQCCKNYEAIKNIKKWIISKQSSEFQRQMDLKRSESEQTATTDEKKACLEIEKAIQNYEEQLHKHKIIIEQEENDILKSSALMTGFAEIVIATKIRLVLLGRTRSMKCAAGNTILGREEGSQAATSTLPQQSESRQGEVAGRKVTVVDTPDWFCPELSLEGVRQDVGLCVRLSAPGPHAFLLVIPVKQPAGEERGMLERMEEMFGERCWRNTMILFTVTDEQQKENIEVFVQSGNQEVSRLVKKCGNRYYCLNIKESGDGSQVLELIEKIEAMVAGNINEKDVSEVIGNMEREREERESGIIQMIQKMQETLQKNDTFIKGYEKDLTGPLNEENKKLIRMLKRECEKKISTGQKILEMYEKVAGLGRSEQFIKVMLPANQHAVWLSVPSRQEEQTIKGKERQLTELSKFFCKVTD
ncbi:uncharacterized protein LOC143518489 [Brachyhypopomus gauderio]|uniref:uncharacterized protein LOC143518489 n=1 Tax=Brachyhypopomus gauderio TaxID=698409 RepID=UPI0040428DBD